MSPELKRKTQPMFMPSPLAKATSSQLGESARELHNSEEGDSMIGRAVGSLLKGMAFCTEQYDELSAATKWNIEIALENDLKWRQMEVERLKADAAILQLQRAQGLDDQRRGFVNWLLGKGWEVCCGTLLLVIGGLVTFVIK